jgi:catechol-2,3-dioxygenase
MGNTSNTTAMSSAETRAAEPSPVEVVKLGFFEVRTPDVERLAAYYRDSLGLVETGRTDSVVQLTTGADHHAVAIASGSSDGRARLGFQIASTLDSAASSLRAAGISAERRHDPEPGIADALVIVEPWSGTPLWLYQSQASSGVAVAVGQRPTKLGHIASYVPELTSAEAFYRRVLGFRWSDTIGDFFTFLRCNRDHHAINLMQSANRQGLFHVAFEMRDFMHLKDQLDHLAARGHRLEWGPGRHGAGHNIFSYHRDPDGNFIELFTELDIIADELTGEFEPCPWHETWPQFPKVWTPEPASANKWGPLNPEVGAH